LASVLASFVFVVATTVAVFADGSSAQSTYCDVDYRIVNSWSNGFQGAIEITNTNAPLSGWTLEFDLPDGQSVEQGWSGDFSQVGSTVTVTSMSWNGDLDTGTTVTPGFIGSWSGSGGTLAIPTSFTLNGEPCNDDTGATTTTTAPTTTTTAPTTTLQTTTTTIPDPQPGGCPPEPSGDQNRDRFMEIYCEVHDPANDYFSPDGVPYHAVETLIVEAPDHGHETTSEAFSYYVWLEAVYGYYTGDWQPLRTAWEITESSIIPSSADQPTSGSYNASDPADYAGEWEQPSQYPSALSDTPAIGADPIAGELQSTYGTSDIYGMHWLLDVDNVYGYGQRGDGVSTPSYINTFQRGEQESVWETVPHPSWEDFQWGGNGTGFVELFVSDDRYPAAAQWRYTNAPDADARMVQAMYWAREWAEAQGQLDEIDDLIDNSSRMGDYLRYAMFDKYFQEIGCQNSAQDNSCAASGRDAQHYLLSWYYSWGGNIPTDGSGWGFRIGSSHNHMGYQNPVAAYVLSQDPDFVPAAATAQQDWATSYQRQLEFYRWLQASNGAIAGGATNSVNGRYEPHGGAPTFYDMAYDDNPVYHDPGSNTWFGFQAWSVERVAEIYYITGDSLAEDILDDWVPWVLSEVSYDANDFSIPATLDWSGQPDTWTGSYTGNPGLSVTVTDHNQDVGIAASTAKALAYYSAAKRVHTGTEHAGARDAAFGLMEALWNYRDDLGIATPESRADYDRFDDPVYVPPDWTGVMGNGETIDQSSTFLSIRSFYEDDPDFQQVESYLNGGPEPTFEYHRFWAQADIAMAYAELDRLFP
jgi:hypothetical protein